jgi:hypothetical protein
VKIGRDRAKKILDSELPLIVDYLSNIKKNDLKLEDLDYNQEKQQKEKDASIETSTYLIERQIRNAGAGFGSPEKNRKVEKAAISFVTKHYKNQGWKVESVEFKKNKGYDLLCTKGTAEEHVEVKGVRGTELSFIITSGEVRQICEDSQSVVCVVTSALSDKPLLSRYTIQEFIDNFELEKLAYRARKRQKEE